MCIDMRQDMCTDTCADMCIGTSHVGVPSTNGDLDFGDIGGDADDDGVARRGMADGGDAAGDASIVGRVSCTV